MRIYKNTVVRFSRIERWFLIFFLACFALNFGGMAAHWRDRDCSPADDDLRPLRAGSARFAAVSALSGHRRGSDRRILLKAAQARNSLWRHRLDFGEPVVPDAEHMHLPAGFQ